MHAPYAHLQHDALAQRLAVKVDALKSTSLDIHRMLQEDNRVLNEMTSDMESTQGGMKRTLQRVASMTKQTRRYCCTDACGFLLFAVALFAAVYALCRCL
jgi:hypothetical protein